MQILDLGARLSKVLDDGQYLGARHDGLRTAEMKILEQSVELKGLDHWQILGQSVDAVLDHAELLGDDVQKLVRGTLKALNFDHDELLGIEAQKLVLGTLKTLKLDHDELLGAEAQKLVLGTLKTLKLDHDELLGMMELQLIQRRLDVVDSAGCWLSALFGIVRHCSALFGIVRHCSA